GSGSATTTEPPPALRGNTTTNTGNVTPDTDPIAIAREGYNNGLPTPTPPPTAQPVSGAQFYVQAGAFASRQDAEQVRARLALAGAQATISQVNAAGQVVHRVRVGPYNTRAEAQATLQRLFSNGIESAIVGS
ncbi:MAG: SPOR domain-containing protein, partial [Saezia sp.]